MNISVRIAGLVMTACALCATSAAQTGALKRDAWSTVASGTVPSGSSLHLKTEGGTIRVEATSERNITYVVLAGGPNAGSVASAAAHFYKVKRYLRGQGVWLTATRTQNSQKIPSQLLVRIPASIKFLELEAGSGAVEIGRVSCRVSIHSKGGSIELAETDGPVFAETSAQDINVGTVGGDGSFRTGAGKISVNRVTGNVDAWTGAGNISVNTGLRDALLRAGAGDIKITTCGGKLTVVSGGGNLLLGDLAGPADIQTNGGNVRVHSARGFVQAQTYGGNIDLGSVPGANAQTGGGSILATFVHAKESFKDSWLRTDAGDITVYIPSDLAVTVQASVDLGSGHRITSEFPEIHVANITGGLPAPILAEGKINGGGALLKLHATTGNISIQRAPSRVQISGLVDGQ